MRFFVDKSVNNRKIRCLRRLKPAEQALYRGRKTSGQDFCCAEVCCFPTTHPVDMHEVIHNRGFSVMLRSTGPGWQIRVVFSLLTRDLYKMIVIVNADFSVDNYVNC